MRLELHESLSAPFATVSQCISVVQNFLTKCIIAHSFVFALLTSTLPMVCSAGFVSNHKCVNLHFILIL